MIRSVEVQDPTYPFCGGDLPGTPFPPLSLPLPGPSGSDGDNSNTGSHCSAAQMGCDPYPRGNAHHPANHNGVVYYSPVQDPYLLGCPASGCPAPRRAPNYRHPAASTAVGGASSANSDLSSQPTVSTSPGVVRLPRNDWERMWCKGICREGDFAKGNRWADDLRNNVEGLSWTVVTTWTSALTSTVGSVIALGLRAPAAVEAGAGVGLGSKVVIGGASSAVSNAGGQYAKTGTVDGTQVAVATIMGASNATFSHLVFSKGALNLAWDMNGSARSNILNYLHSQSLYAAYNFASSVIVSRALGLGDACAEGRANQWNQIFGAARSAGWQAFFPPGSGAPFEFGTPAQGALDSMLFGVPQKLFINAMEPDALTR
jgi:hypothetical protein